VIREDLFTVVVDETGQYGVVFPAFTLQADNRLIYQLEAIVEQRILDQFLHFSLVRSFPKTGLYLSLIENRDAATRFGTGSFTRLVGVIDELLTVGELCLKAGNSNAATGGDGGILLGGKALFYSGPQLCCIGSIFLRCLIIQQRERVVPKTCQQLVRLDRLLEYLSKFFQQGVTGDQTGFGTDPMKIVDRDI